jgi:hypothetical protein
VKSKARKALDWHDRVKATRQRGTETPGHLATLAYLRGLEADMERVRDLLNAAWFDLDASRDFRKASKHMDAAQQRMHRAIKRLTKKRRD